MVVLWSLGRLTDEVTKYFPFCPFCANRIITAHRDSMSEPTATCSKCGAKWHFFLSTWKDDLKAADLVRVSSFGGEQYLGINYKAQFWRDLALSNQKKKPHMPETNTETTTVREIIKEKEVIVKVRCPYCRKLFNETANTCPNCGASNNNTLCRII